jgi:DNA-binding MarR family transcriptional regulator
VPEPARLDDADYRALAAFRAELRRFLRFSEEAARRAGVTPQQHQVLLAVRGHPGPGGPSVSDLADALGLRLNSTTELVARTEAAGLLTRTADDADRRRTLCHLTPAGDAALRHLTDDHRTELRRLRAVVDGLTHLGPD